MMTHLGKTARLSMSTVTRVSTGDVPTAARGGTRRRRTGTGAAAAPTGAQRGFTKVNPGIWLLAMHAADGDALRIQVVGPEQVIVHNNRDWRKRRAR